MRWRFIIDAQLPPALAERLCSRGLEAQHVNRIGLRVATDSEIWAYAVEQGAALITKDEDFVRLARSGTAWTPVIWLRIGNIMNRALWRSLEPVLPDVLSALEAGDRIVEID